MLNRTNELQVRIEPWAEADLALLHRMNAPEMLEHLGGPETEEQILARHKRYVEIGGKGNGRMFSIVLLPELEAVGNIGYWKRVWQEETVYEIGWGVLPTFQGRGIASAATAAAVASARRNRRAGTFTHSRQSITPHRMPFAGNSTSSSSPSAASNTLPGSFMRCNDWRLDLTAEI